MTSPSSFRVLSFNTASFNDGPLWCSTLTNEHGLPLWNFKDRHRKIVKKMILEENAEVVCLQESVIKAPAAEQQSNRDGETPMTFMKRRQVKIDSYNNRSEGDDEDDDQNEELHQQVLRDAHIDQDEISELNNNNNNDDNNEGKDANNTTTTSATAKKLTSFSLDNNNNDADDENQVDAAATALSFEQKEELRDPLPGYRFIGQTATHADLTNLWVRKDLEVVKIDCVGGERGGDMYNFPICVLKLAKENSHHKDREKRMPYHHHHHFVAIASVHMTPFSSGGGGRRGKETRRETQLRKTTHALYRSLDDYFFPTVNAAAVDNNSNNNNNEDATVASIISNHNNNVSSFSIIVAGDTNMRNEEHSVAKKSLQLTDAYDHLVSRVPSSSRLMQYQNKDMVSRRPATEFSNNTVNDDNDESSISPLYTWNTCVNRYNGQGPEYCARYDRLYVRTFENNNIKNSDEDLKLKLLNLMKESLSIDSSIAAAEEKEKEELLFDERRNNKQGDHAIDEEEDVSSPFRIESFKLFGHEPIFDAEIDEVDRRTLAELCEMRKKEIMEEKNNEEAADGDQKSCGKAGGWVSVFRDSESDNDDDANTNTFSNNSNKLQLPDTKAMPSNDPNSNQVPTLSLAQATNTNEGRTDLQKSLELTKFDELIFELAMNEHTNEPPPVPEGRKRFLSDHFGFVVDFSY